MFGSAVKVLKLRELLLPAMLFTNPVVATALFRESHWDEFGGYKEAMSKGLEDFEFWLNFHGRGLRFIKVEESVFYCPNTEGSMSRAENTKPGNYRKMMMNLFRFHEALYREHAESIFSRLISLEIRLLEKILLYRKQRKERRNKRQEVGSWLAFGWGVMES